MKSCWPKIAFVHNFLLDYRKPLFSKLAYCFNFNFFFEASNTSFESNFSFSILKLIKLTKSFSFSPSLPLHLINGKFSLFIGCGIGQINTYITFLISRILRKKFIFWDEQWYWPLTPTRFILWPFLRLIVRKSSSIIVPGSASKHFYESILGKSDKKIIIAPNVSKLINYKKYIKSANKLKNQLKLDNKKVILYFGRLIEGKGIRYLLKAYCELRKRRDDIALIVVGDSPKDDMTCSRQNLNCYCKSEKICDVFFFKGLYTPDKAIYFLISDVVVVPSLFLNNNSEIWGFALNEAMYVGKPVIATSAVGAAYDLIENGKNGFIVPANNIKALSNALESVVENSSIGQKMGLVSQRKINFYTYDNMYKGFEKAIIYSITKNATYLK